MTEPAALRWRFVLVLLAVTATACTRVVDLGLDDAPVQLVVEGNLLAGDADQSILLTTTDALGSAQELPRVSGALVEVTDDLGNRIPFPEAERGAYRATSTLPRPGGRYTLRIVWQGEVYQATSDLPSGPPIDSLYLKYLDASLAVGDSGYRAVLDYRDPPGERNYYFWQLYVNGGRRGGLDPGNRWREISTDKFYDGQPVIGYLPFDEDVLEPGDHVELRQFAITEEAYRFYFAFYDQATGGGTPFSTPPASVRGNIANLTRPEHRALGFFLVSQVRVRSLLVPDP